MNYEEEQTMEIESLECILMDDLQVLSSTTPRQYQVKILPYANGEGDNHVGVQATFSLPATYPDVPAEVDLAPEKGLGSAQIATLQALVKSTALENVGMAMVYLLVEVVRDWLIENNLAGQDGSMHAEMLKRMHHKEKEKQRATEKEEAKVRAAQGDLSEEDEMQRQKRLDGTPVTPESFVEWRDKFEIEVAAKAAAAAAAKAGPVKEKVQQVGGPEKPSGKEMFLRHLAGTAEEDEEEAQVDEEEEARAMEVNAELFGEEDDDEEDSDFELDSDEDDDDDDDSDFDDEEESEESEDGGKGKGKGGGGGGKKGGRKR